MEYDYFIGMVKQYEADRVKAYCGSVSSSTTRIPRSFALLIQEIIRILENNLEKLCGEDEGIVLSGLQPASQMIESMLPTALNRTIDQEQFAKHLCCTLEYMVLPRDQLANTTQWHHTHSLIVDFTLGIVMDASEYVARMTHNSVGGIIYGNLSRESLDTVWKIVKLKHEDKIIVA